MDARIKALIGAHAVAFVFAAMAASGHTGPDPAPIIFLAFVLAALTFWQGGFTFYSAAA